jgi:membrane-bound hydrogenase subunit alpha
MLFHVTPGDTTRGNDVTLIRLPFGPQHPALDLESIHFTFEVDGERVVSVQPRLGYMHRGIEKLAELRTYQQNIHLVERICGICSQAHAICFSQAVEEIAHIQIPNRARYLRTIIAELERIQNHFLWLGVAAHEIGFQTLFMYTWRDRELVLDAVEAMTGKRVNYGINTIGGLRRDLTSDHCNLLQKTLDQLETRSSYYKKICTTEPTILKRTVDVGVLTKTQAITFGAVGPTARASGIARDIRRDDPYAAYDEIPFNVITSTGCDVASRLNVRLDELFESIEIIRYALTHLPEGKIQVQVPRSVPPGDAISRVEAPRGEDFHYVRANGTNKPARVKVRAPTLANILPLCNMFTGMNIADIPIVIAGIDPCIACAERLTIHNISTDTVRVVSRGELKHISQRNI